MGKQRKTMFGSSGEDETGYDLIGGAMLAGAMALAILLLVAVRSLG